MNTGVLDLESLDRAYVCVVQLKTQPAGALQQVTLRPDKVHDGLIRLGETPGDEAFCWIDPRNVMVMAVLGTEQDGQCVPLAA